MDNKRKFETNGKSILIPLNYKGYEVEANITRTETPNEYNVIYKLGCIGFSHLDRIEGDIFTICTDKNANWEVYNFTMGKFREGYFKPFMERYEIEMTAMNKGMELLEAERGVQGV